MVDGKKLNFTQTKAKADIIDKNKFTAKYREPIAVYAISSQKLPEILPEDEDSRSMGASGSRRRRCCYSSVPEKSIVRASSYDVQGHVILARELHPRQQEWDAKLRLCTGDWPDFLQLRPSFQPTQLRCIFLSSLFYTLFVSMEIFYSRDLHDLFLCPWCWHNVCWRPFNLFHLYRG